MRIHTENVCTRNIILCISAKVTNVQHIKTTSHYNRKLLWYIVTIRSLTLTHVTRSAGH